MKIDLSGLTVLVTGASGGIGYEISSQCMKAGATLAVHYNSNQKRLSSLIKNANGKIMTKKKFSKPSKILNSTA